MAVGKLILKIELKWYAKPIIFICCLLGLRCPKFVFNYEVVTE